MQLWGQEQLACCPPWSLVTSRTSLYSPSTPVWKSPVCRKGGWELEQSVSGGVEGRMVYSGTQGQVQKNPHTD